MRRLAAVAATTVLVLVVVGCGGQDGEDRSGSEAPTVAPADVERYDEPGPHGVGVRTWPTDDGSESVTLWYPAEGSRTDPVAPDAGPAAIDGTVPLLVFAHGLSLVPEDYGPLLAHVASWGIVVAAPARTRDLDAVAFAAGVRSDVAAEAPGLASLLPDGAPLVVGGHSRGTDPASSAGLQDDVAGVLLLAGGGATRAVAASATPTLGIGGGRDGATDTWLRANLEGADGPHQLVVVQEAGHLSFTSLCQEPNRARLTPSYCAAAAVGEAAVQPPILHAVVAFVRWRAGIDGTPAALVGDVLESFDTPVAVEGSFPD